MGAQRPEHPGRCADCGGDAYIQLDPRNGGALPELVCAHCYVDRVRVGTLRPAGPYASPSPSAGEARGSAALRRR